MKFKSLASGAVIASLSFSPAMPFATYARADGRDVVAGLIIGGIIGSAIASEKGKKKSKSKAKTKSTKAKAASVSPEVKAANIEVQEALNHFDWPVGTADGALGNKSKAAIKEYQAFMGFPVTGDLTDHERTVLVTAYHRSEAGGSAISEIVSGSVYGLRGVLLAQEDEMTGDATMASAGVVEPDGAVKPGAVAAAAAAAIPVLLPGAQPGAQPGEDPTVAAPAAAIVPTPAPVVAPAAPVIEAAATPAPAPVVTPEPAPAVEPVAATEPDTTDPGLPTFMDSNGTKGSLVSECNAVAMKTSTNGSYVTAANMDDANFALAEQFCLARSFAVAKGQEMTAKVAGFTPDQIAAQCAALAPALKEHVAALSLRPEDEVLKGVENFMLTSGMSPAQLSGTAKVCLGVGYANDQMDVAIGSALLLTAMGEKGYAELLGHHLSQGFGAVQRPDLAEAWYETAVAAMAEGGAVFAPGLAGRGDLILKASYTLTGHAGDLETGAVVQEAALPSFVVAPEPAAVAEVPVAAPAPEATTVAPTETALEPAPVVAPATEGALMRVEGPGADAMRMSVDVARMVAQLPMMALNLNR